MTRGSAYRGKADYGRAMANYNIAIALAPTFGNEAEATAATSGAYGGRGLNYLKQGEYDLAIVDLSVAIGLDRTNLAGALNYDARGFAYSNKGEYDKAIADYTVAIALDPNNPEYYLWRGNAYRANGEYDQAIADYAEAIKLNPNDAENRRLKGAALREKGEYDRALADLDKAIQLAPDEALPYISPWTDLWQKRRTQAGYSRLR